jgi:GNAT superfamily N-acetyltransferase
MMKICNTFDKEFLQIANVLFTPKCQKEMGWQVYLYPGMNFIYSEYGFVSYRFEKDICHFDYAYIYPEYRGHGEYKRLFKEREKNCKDKICRVNTKNPILKDFLYKNGYEPTKIHGQWIYFEKHL